MTTMGQRVARERARKGWTQKELAARAHVPYETIHRLEKGVHAGTRVDVLVALARTLGTTTDYLCGMYEATESPLFPTARAL